MFVIWDCLARYMQGYKVLNRDNKGQGSCKNINCL